MGVRGNPLYRTFHSDNQVELENTACPSAESCWPQTQELSKAEGSNRLYHTQAHLLAAGGLSSVLHQVLLGQGPAATRGVVVLENRELRRGGGCTYMG